MSTALVFDIETGPLPEEQLRALYQPPTWEEFSASCDQRWKEDTRRAKFAEAEASGWEQFVNRAALSPITGRVLAIGLKSESGTAIIGEDGEPEEDILDAFWLKFRLSHHARRRLIGHNCAGFDVPFLERRSWWHNVMVPENLWVRERYLCDTFADLMLRWQAGSRDQFVKLDTLARYFGVGQKPDGVGGGDFGRLWLGTAEERATAVAYLHNDLEMTWRVAERMGAL